jgi:hypothetical protein
MWYNPVDINGVRAGIAEIVQGRSYEVRFYMAKSDADGSMQSHYLSLDEAENFALNILAMVTDVKRNGY